MKAVLADIDADRRHLPCCLAGHGSCSLCCVHPEVSGRVADLDRKVLAMARDNEESIP
jgi:hypothetical protein